MATDFGSVATVENGWQAFVPGDYIVTDDPPTNAWPVAQEHFDRLYERAEG